MWRALKAPCRGYPAETETSGVRPSIPTRHNSGLKQFDQSRTLSCQLVQVNISSFWRGGWSRSLWAERLDYYINYNTCRINLVRNDFNNLQY